MRRTHRRPHDEANDFLDIAIPSTCLIQGDTLSFPVPVNPGERIESLYGRKGRIVSFCTGHDGHKAIKLVRVQWDDTQSRVNYIYHVEDNGGN